MNNQLIVTSLALVMFFCLPSLVFTQSLNLYKGKKSSKYQPDAFADYMLKANNPCNNNRYLELRNRPQSEMSEQDYALLKQKTMECQGYLISIENSKPDLQVEVLTGKKDPWKPFLFLGASAVVIRLVLLS